MDVTDTNDSVEAQAAAWFARARGVGRARADEEGLSAWLAQPEHAAAYARIERIWGASGALADDPDIQRVTAAALQGARKRPARVHWRNWLAPSLGAAALVVLALVMRPIWVTSHGPATFTSTYQTGQDASTPFVLPDGSTVRLNVHSFVHVAYDENQRSLILETGEAVFDVEHDAERPFTVRAGDVLVKATGTRFSVRRYSDRVAVALVEGAVDVRSERAEQPLHAVLSPGEYVEFTDRGESFRRTINPSATLAWTEGKLVFESVPVSAAIAEFNRYAPDDIPADLSALYASQRETPITGVFDIDDPASFVAALNAMLPVRNSDSEGTRRSDPP